MKKRTAFVIGGICVVALACAMLLFFQKPKEKEEPKTVSLLVSAIPFTIENARGEKLIHNGHDFSGNMEVLGDIYTPAVPAKIKITVLESEWFTYEESEAMEYSFGVTGSGHGASARGENIDKVKITSDGKVELYGKDMDYQVGISAWTPGEDNYTDFSKSGFATSDISLWFTTDADFENEANIESVG